MENITNKTKQGATGPLVGSIIIIFIVIAGGVYLFNILRSKTASNNIPADSQLPSEFEGSDPEIVDIVSEIDSIEMDSINKELDAIDAEIDEALDF